MPVVNRIARHLVLISVGAAVAACSTDASVTRGTDGGPSADGSDVGSGGHSTGGSAGGGGRAGSAGGHSGSSGGASSGGGRPGPDGSVAAGGRTASGGNSDAGDAGPVGKADAGDAADSGSTYRGPTVGTAKQFAALAYDAVTTANISTIVGSIGVSAAAISTITGFDGGAYKKYGSDSLAPNSGLTGLAQRDVTALVGNIDPRACDDNLTNVVGGLTGDITLHPGVTCMNSFSADVLVNGHVYLDAGGDPNAFFVIRGKKTLTVADGAQVVLTNNARACGVFWRISEAITIGKTVDFQGTLIAGTAITMKTASTLHGRALAQTAGIHLDANTITAPSDAECPHVQ